MSEASNARINWSLRSTVEDFIKLHELKDGFYSLHVLFRITGGQVYLEYPSLVDETKREISKNE